jgi:hypothetical protein
MFIPDTMRQVYQPHTLTPQPIKLRSWNLALALFAFASLVAIPEGNLLLQSP